MMLELVAVLPVVLEQALVPDVAVEQVLAQVVAVQVSAVALAVVDKQVPFAAQADGLGVVAEHYPKTVLVQPLVVALRFGIHLAVALLGKALGLVLHFDYAHLAFEYRLQ